ncbi:T-cell immunoglobulin and mucin domain-containing protein 4-like isoform X2 [Thunnus thynnus]|uniref:T-cell immunoglobulin and mucin domain-containing protein 4-like isoform X2 n=1 Tax=Thunnus thynnus TaxID=8237 RepID=UPI003528B622
MTTLKRFNWLLLALLSVIECSSSSMKVVGRAGENITLLCEYDIKHNGATSVCWGRGSIPLSGCNDQIISTDGHKVIESTRVSSRYQLLGRLDDGNVSLTILNTTEEDAGRYGCRVQISGLNNDEKHHIDLIIEKAPQSTTSTTTKEKTSTEQTTDTYETSHVTSAESLPTSPPDSAKAEPQQTSSSTTVVLVSVLFALIALVTAGVIIIIARRSNRLKIPQQQQVFSSVQFRSTSTTLQLQSRGSAVENIYQIDGDGDGSGDYELCP